MSFATLDIVTDVVKVAIRSEATAHGDLRVFGLWEIEECKARLFTRHIDVGRGAWFVRLVFHVTLRFRDKHGHEECRERLVFFDERVPFPPGCHDCDDLTPRLEISDIHCRAFAPKVHGLVPVELAVHFHLVVKGLKKEEITVVVPPR